jgi:SAF domain
MSQSDADTTRGFRPSARRRNRIAAGIALGAAAIGGNVLLYTSLDDKSPVVQAVTDIPAGAQITPDMLRTVEVDLDETVLAVPGSELALVPGQYAKVRIVSGSLVVTPALQSDPLVADGAAVVAIEVARTLVPSGVRERSRVDLVYVVDGVEVVVAGHVVGLPFEAEGGSDIASLSVEVATADAPGVATAEDVRVVLLTPDDAALDTTTPDDSVPDDTGGG